MNVAQIDVRSFAQNQVEQSVAAWHQGHRGHATAAINRLLATLGASLASHELLIMDLVNQIGQTLHVNRTFELALIVYQWLAESHTARQGNEHPEVANVLVQQGRVLLDMGRFPEAQNRLEKALEIVEPNLRSDDRLIGHAHFDLARAFRGQQAGERAKEHAYQALAVFMCNLSIDPNETASAMQFIADSYTGSETPAAALSWLEGAIEIWQPRDPRLVRHGAQMVLRLARLALEANRLEKAEEILISLKNQVESSPELQDLLDTTLKQLCLVYRFSSDRMNSAISVADQRIAHAARRHGTDSLEVAVVHFDLVYLQRSYGNLPAAKESLYKAAEILQQHEGNSGQEKERAFSVLCDLADLCGEARELPVAIELYERALALAHEVEQYKTVRILSLLANYGAVLADSHRLPDSIARLEEGLRLLRGLGELALEQAHHLIRNVVRIYADVDRLTEAEDSLIEAVKRVKKSKSISGEALVRIFLDLSLAYSRTDDWRATAKTLANALDLVDGLNGVEEQTVADLSWALTRAAGYEHTNDPELALIAADSLSRIGRLATEGSLHQRLDRLTWHARLLLTAGRKAEARARVEEAEFLAVKFRTDRTAAAAEVNGWLAHLLIDLGDPHRALLFIGQAVVCSPPNADVGFSGDFVLPLFDQTLEAIEEPHLRPIAITAVCDLWVSELGPKHRLVEWVLRRRAYLYSRTDHNDLAESDLQRALAIQLYLGSDRTPLAKRLAGDLVKVRVNQANRQTEPRTRYQAITRALRTAQRCPWIYEAEDAYLLPTALGDLFRATSHHHQAVDAYVTAVKRWRRQETSAPPDFTADLLLLNLADEYRALGDNLRCSAAAHGAVRLLEKNRRCATNLISARELAGRVEWRLGRRDRALAVLEPGLEESKGLLESAPLLVARFSGVLGVALAAVDRTDEAYPLLRRAVVKLARSGDRRDRDLAGESAIQLGNFYLNQGQRFRAAWAFEKGLSLSVGIDLLKTEDHLRLAAFIANVYFPKRPAELQRICGEALDAAGPDAEQFPQLRATLLRTLGEASRLLGDLNAAERVAVQALEQLLKLPDADPMEIVNCHSILGNVYFRAGNITAATTHYEQALDLLSAQPDPDETIVTTLLDNLSPCLMVQGRPDQALDCCRRAVAYFERGFGAGHIDTLVSKSNLASILGSLGKLNEARGVYEEVLVHEAELRRGSARTYGIFLDRFGMACFDTGDTERGRDLIERALEVFRRETPAATDSVIICLRSLAWVEISERNISSAFARLVEAEDTEDSYLPAAFRLLDEPHRLQYLGRRREAHNLLMTIVWQAICSATEDASRILPRSFDVWLRRKGLVAEYATRQEQALRASKDSEVIEALRRRDELRRRVAEPVFLTSSKNDGNGQDQSASSPGHVAQALDRLLSARSDSLELVDRLKDISTEAVAERLPEGSVLVEFVHFFERTLTPTNTSLPTHWGPGRYVAFILPSGDPRGLQAVDLGESSVIDDLVVQFRRGVALPSEARTDTEPDTRAVGLRLRETVFDPVLTALGDRNCREFVLSLDSELTRLAFEVLPLEKPGRHVIDCFMVSYVGSGRDVLDWKETSLLNLGSGVSAAVGEAFDWSEDGGVTRDFAAASNDGGAEAETMVRREGLLPAHALSGSLEEARIVSQMTSSALLLEQEVTAQRILDLTSPPFLHLATHAFFLANIERDPRAVGAGLTALDHQGLNGRLLIADSGEVVDPMLRSGLLLAGVNGLLVGSVASEASPGYLTARDVSEMNLRGTEMVVLSACETGVGETLVGEGVFGLQRAFFVAGARSLIMSLWKVPDDKTVELMESFYRYLSAGRSRVEALRQARLDLKESLSDDPANWAAWGGFVAMGYSGPLLGVDQRQNQSALVK